MKKHNILHNVTIELLNYCNSACIHCYLQNTIPQENKFENVLKIIDQSVEAGAMQITLTGGEPLLHPKIVEIIKYIKSKGVAINLLTSLNVKRGEWFECISLCDKVGVSLYGGSKNIHDQITRINGSFDNMRDNLNYLISKKVFVTLNITIMNENVDDVSNMINFAKQTTEQYRLNYFLHGTMSQKHQIGYDKIRSLKKMLISNDNTNTLSEQFKCTAGSSSLWVDTDLNVFPCVFFRKQIGNLFNQTLLDIWNNSDVLSIIKQTSNTDFKKCQACELKYICNPCIGENYNANGDITLPCNFSCRVGEYNKCLMEC